MHRTGNTDPAGLGQCFEARRNVDPVAEDVLTLGDDVAKVDPYAKPDAALLGYLLIAVKHCALDLGGAAHRVDDTGEFR